MNEVSHALFERLRDEHDKGLSGHNRLKVQLLLLNPKSSEGQFRYSLEKETIAGEGLIYDVPNGLRRLQTIANDIYGPESSEFLQARVYDHGSFGFHFISDRSAFVEQYSYRDHRILATLPLVQYEAGSNAYNQLQHSFKTIWAYSEVPNLNPHNVGTAKGILEAQIGNIYRFDQREFVGPRQLECLRAAKPGDTIDILAISGRYYMRHEAFRVIEELSKPTQLQGQRRAP